MDVGELLEKLKIQAIQDAALMQSILNTRSSDSPISDLCKLARDVGIELYEMDLVAFGEESYAAMRRSTNGGGENAPMLKWENDAYEMFLAEIEMLLKFKEKNDGALYL